MLCAQRKSAFRKPSRLLFASAATVPLLASAAMSQEAQEVEELPLVVVEGATLEIPKTSKKARTASPTASEVGAGDTNTGVSGDTQAQSQGGVPESTTGEIAGVALDEIGSAVSVVTSKQLQAQQIRHAADALRSLPGVAVSGQGTPNNLTVVRIRGSESNHTLVLIDGVEVNAIGNDGFFDFSSLDADEIEQIEVIRGPQGGLYGTGAIGGVVNIITKGGKGPLTIRARGEGGAFNTRDGALQVSGGNDELHGSITIQGNVTDGYNISTAGNEKDGGRLSTFAFRGGVKVFENLKLDGTLRMSTNRADRDDGFGGLDSYGFFIPADDLSFFTNRLWVGRLAATVDTFDGLWKHKLHVEGAETDNQDTAVSASGNLFTQNISQNIKYGYTTTYRLEEPSVSGVSHVFTGLVEHEHEAFEQPSDATSPDRSRNRLSFVGEVRGEYFQSLFLTGTLRYDDNETIEDFTTWRATGSFAAPNTPFRLHSSVGTGVKYPSFSELFGDFPGFISNPGLTPEEAIGWDAGIETTLWPGRATVDVTYFDTTLTNEIDFETVFIGGDVFFRPFNREGESRRRGIEVAARYLVFEGLTLGAAYTYLDAKEEDGREEVRRAPHSGRLDANYRFDNGRGNVNVAAIYNGKMSDIVFNLFDPLIDRVELDSYWLLNIAASYEVSPGVALYGRVENALDENYQEVFGFETAGVAAYAGVRFTYEELASVARPKGQ